MRKIKSLANYAYMVIAAIGLIAIAEHEANATVITFNGTASEATSTFAVGTTHSEGGFSVAFSNTGIAFYSDNNINFPGVSTFDDDVVLFNGDSPSFVLTNNLGSLFDLSSVRTGSLGRPISIAADDGNFIFVGTFGAGGTITQTVLGLEVPATTLFSGWTGLSSVSVTSSDSAFPVLDDLIVSLTIVSEPGTLAVLGLGLAGLGFGRRRRAI